MLNVGFSNYINKSKILSITQAKSSPLRRIRKQAEESGMLIDCTEGRRTRSLIYLKDGYVALSAVQTDTLSERFEGIKNRRVAGTTSPKCENEN